MVERDLVEVFSDWSLQGAQEVLLPIVRTVKPLWDGIGYRVGEDRMLTPLLEVREIISYPKLRKIPAVVPWFKGIAMFRGELLAVSDIQGMLTANLQVVTHLSRVLVVPWAGQLSGFLVSAFEGLQIYQEEEQKVISLQSPYRKYVRGTVVQGDNTWTQLSLRQIVDSYEFNRISEEKKLGYKEAL